MTQPPSPWAFLFGIAMIIFAILTMASLAIAHHWKSKYDALKESLEQPSPSQILTDY